MSTQAFKTPMVLDVCLPVYELRYGMFVANVDCGWQKTPFGETGLLITAPQQIATLAGLTEYVTVDPTRSQDFALKEYLKRTFGSENYHVAYEDLDTLAGITAVESPAARNEPAFDTDYVTNDEQEAPPAAVNRISGGLMQKVGRWWNGFGRAAPASATGRGAAPNDRKEKNGDLPRPAYIPPDIPLTAHGPSEFSWQALPVAMSACSTAVEVIEQLGAGIAKQSVNNVRVLERAAEILVEHTIAYPGAMMWAAKFKRNASVAHKRSLETGIYLTLFGRHLNLGREALADLAIIGILLDLGKMKLDVALLEKQGLYNAPETETARNHVTLGLSMLSRIETLKEPILRAIAEHHEQVDGNGYPKGLKGPKISLYGKMAAIVDGYVAMVNPRPYASTLAPHEAIRQLFAGVHTRWFGPLVEQFVEAIGIYPVGSLVELNTGHLAIVVQHNPAQRLEPKVLIVTHSDKKPRLPPLQIDIYRHNERQSKTRLQIGKGLAEGAYGLHVRDFHYGRR